MCVEPRTPYEEELQVLTARRKELLRKIEWSDVGLQQKKEELKETEAGIKDLEDIVFQDIRERISSILMVLKEEVEWEDCCEVGATLQRMWIKQAGLFLRECEDCDHLYADCTCAVMEGTKPFNTKR